MRLMPTQPPRSKIRTLRVLLAQEHAELEALFGRLLAAVNADVTLEIATLWSEFDSRLRAHLELEDKHILGAFGLVHPIDAAHVRDEHAQIRATLLELGVGIDLHLS